jgi:uncharacterized membrane protein YphA (DoxX/SURF4 family)
MKVDSAAVGRWSMAIIPAAVLLAGGAAKFTSAAQWESDFTTWGYPVALVPVLGVIEIIVGALILWERVRFSAAAAGAVIMMGASVTQFVNGNPGPGVFTLFITFCAGISAWWYRPDWLHNLFYKPEPEPKSQRAKQSKR